MLGLTGPSAGRAPALLFDRVWREMLRIAQVEAPSTPGKALVICTPMAADGTMMLGSPWKSDWDRFYPFELMPLWAEHAAQTADTLQVSRPGLMVLPLWRLASRYRWMRCDGIHFGSFMCPSDGCGPLAAHGELVALKKSSCWPKLGVYHGLLAAAGAATLRSHAFDDEIGRRHGTWTYQDSSGSEPIRYRNDGKLTLQAPARCPTRTRGQAALASGFELARTLAAQGICG